MAYSPDEDYKGYKEYGDRDGYEYEQEDETQLLEEREKPIKKSGGKSKVFLLVSLVFLVLVLACLVDYYFFGFLLSPDPAPAKQEQAIGTEKKVTAKEPEIIPLKEDVKTGTRPEADIINTDPTLSFEEEIESLYTYIERRPIPPNPFAPIDKEQPATLEPEKPEEEQAATADVDESEEEIEEIAAGFISRLKVKGIVGYEENRLAILEEDGQSFIINEGNIIELFNNDGILREQWRVEEITKTKVILFELLRGLSRELVLGGER